jgi:D-alanyl-D-alanine carboxypeptidase/D-alanyl-D-alanine-endopeptidase (penicillin-binding protein 4)
MKKILLLLGLFIPTFLVFPQHEAFLNRFVSSDNLSSAAVSVLIKEVETGKDIAEYRSATNRNPASLVKLLSTATALEMLGDTFRFKTQIEHDGYITGDSILIGNLYIKGGGDPTLESFYRKTPSNFYVESVRAIQLYGIKAVEGHVVGDASLFEESGSPGQWLVEDIGSSYSPAPSALSVHDNILHLTVKSDFASAEMVGVRPFTNRFLPAIEYREEKTKPVLCSVSKTDFDWNPLVRVRMPSNKKITIQTEMPDPALFVADSLAGLLQLVGIPVSAASTTMRSGNIGSDERKLIYTYYSEPLKDIVKEANYRSLNLYAENMFNYLALQKDSVATSKQAAAVVSAFWKKSGIPMRGIFQSDGSGLSMKNAINARFFVDLLVYMKTNGIYGDAFLSSLPLAGKSGTVATFLKGSRLEGKVYVKSGSMERVQNYAGYIHHKNKWYAFCIMLNNYDGDRQTVRKQIATFLNAIFPDA